MLNLDCPPTDIIVYFPICSDFQIFPNHRKLLLVQISTVISSIISDRFHSFARIFHKIPPASPKKYNKIDNIQSNQFR